MKMRTYRACITGRDALCGEGAGRKRTQALVERARAERLLVIPVCPFAKSKFERDASIRDVLA